MNELPVWNNVSDVALSNDDLYEYEGVDKEYGIISHVNNNWQNKEICPLDLSLVPPGKSKIQERDC